MAASLIVEDGQSISESVTNECRGHNGKKLSSNRIFCMAENSFVSVCGASENSDEWATNRSSCCYCFFCGNAQDKLPNVLFSIIG